MFSFLFNQRLSSVPYLYMGHYADAKVFYTSRFNRLPCISFIGELETTKAFAFIQNTYAGWIKSVYQHNYYDHDERKFFFNNTLFVLKNKRMIEIGHNYAQVLYTNKQFDWGQAIINELSVFHVTTGANKVIGFARTNQDN